MKNPIYADAIVLMNGGFIETEAGTDIVSVSAAWVPTINTTTETVVDLTTTGNTVIGNASTDTLTVNSKLTGQIYSNQTGYTAQVLKIHNHATTSGIGSYEGKADTVNTSGAFYGLWQDANIGATGTASSTAILGVAVVSSTFTVTGGTIIGTYGQARADGTVAGSGFMAGLYGLIEEGGGAITASHVASARLDSHRNTAVTGSHEILYMTNNGTAVMDQAIFLYGWDDKIAALIELNKCKHANGIVTDGAETAGSAVKLKITVDWTAYRINAYPWS